MQYKIKSVKVGFGVTIMPPTVGGNVLKYYFEPEIEFKVPAEGDGAEELQQHLDKICTEVTEMVRQSVKKKAKADKGNRDSQ